MHKYIYTASLLLMSTLLSAQNSPIADFLANYEAVLNNYGDKSYQLTERRLFRAELITNYFLFDKGSMVWNHLRPDGTAYITAEEYLNNMLIDFPNGWTVGFSAIEIGPLQTEGDQLKVLIRLRCAFTPGREAARYHDLQFLLLLTDYSQNLINARIKSIDKAAARSQPVLDEGNSGEDLYWQGVRAGDTESGYRSYLDRYPSGKYVAEARRRIAEKTKPELDSEEEKYWQVVAAANTESGYQSYLSRYPGGKYVGEAQWRIRELNESGTPAELVGIARNMVQVKGGVFRMGCTSEQGVDCGSDELPSHRVDLSDYEIGKYEVTQAEWRAVMGTNPSKFSGCDACPVEQVSWNDVQVFLRKLNEMTNGDYRLPTEAEWEYAARGGIRAIKYKYSGSNGLNEVAWYKDNSGSRTHPVGQNQANELGLYDMSGNVREWCSDRYGMYQSYAQVNPKGPSSGSRRVYRGCSWFNESMYCGLTNRSSDSPTYQNNGIGFRLARSSPQ